MATATTKTPVILAGPDDWDEWIEIVQTTTRKADIWNLVNPSTAKEKLPKLEPPKRPTPDDVKETTTPVVNTPSDNSQTAPSTSTTAPTRFSQLTEDEKEQLRILQKDYEYERKKYDQRTDALNDLRVHIQSTVERTQLSYTFKCETPYDMLIKLKGRFAPTDRAREQDSIREWKKLQKAPKSQDIDK